MSGKIVGILILIAAIAMGGGAYYATVYGYYDDVEAGSVELTSLVSGEPEEIIFEGFEGIDANSSPIRYRACFTTPMSTAMLTETYETFEEAEPLNAPGWFDCFDAPAIAEALADGSATAFTGQRNIQYGIDRVVAIFDDGRGYAWQQINDCGDKLYDGSPKGDECPERELD
ncbi:DUF6446 family protein [Shimia ponticola]|uniref:DUF6446 family protein n=1 Tax=Shimia ponticola TaxID=2582893 RepID=UPI00164ABF81|nr:DUF6446 family protein [Shimia ponticola]